MKIAKNLTKVLFFILLAFDIAVFSAVFYLSDSVGNSFKVKKGDTLNISSPLPVTAVYNGTELSSRHTSEETDSISVDLKMFGIIPFTKANVRVVDEMQVAVLGEPFGMKLYTKGVLVVDIADIPTETGNQNPAEESGLKIGDYIVTANGKKISANEDLVEVVEESKDSKIKLQILRENKQQTLYITPVISTDTDSYKIGVWVRDSSAGIGTLTFYSPATDIICGLGHGVSDEDTGKLLKIESGEIVKAKIFDVEKGKKGTPGQLKGRLTAESLGDIVLNCSGGVYSVINGEIPFNNLIEVALKTEVTDGDAQILCAVENSAPKLYDCRISLKKGKINAETQNMVVTVTDTELLEKTGGIVQGMSGSPVVQNGKLVGAITHVLVDDPTRGYAIFAENMLETAQSVAEQQLRAAS